LLDSKALTDEEGWYCKVQGKIDPTATPESPSQCYYPMATIYLDCIPDPDYVPPEEEIVSYEGTYSDPNTIGKPIIETEECREQGQVAVGGECIAGPNTKVIGTGELGDYGFTCEFQGEDSDGQGLVSGFYYPPEGTIRVDCF